MAYRTDETEEPAETMKATRARQGSWGRHIFWVLIISTILAAIALFASFAFYAPALQGDGAQERELKDAPAFDAPARAPVTSDAERTGPYPAS